MEKREIKILHIVTGIGFGGVRAFLLDYYKHIDRKTFHFDIIAIYAEAFDLAKISYEKNPYNTYHIEAYFRCLVRSSHYDIDTLYELMSKMKESLDTKGKTIYCAMEAEYSYYICNDFSKAIRLLTEEIECNHENPYPWRSLKEICESSDSLRIYNSLRKKYKMSNNVEDIDFEND